MGRGKRSSRGFTLIASLLIMMLLSGVAIGLLYLVDNELSASGNGKEDTLAYYGAEAGMEKLTSDLAALYQTSQSPQNSQIQDLKNHPPDSTMVDAMNYVESIDGYTLVNNSPTGTPSTISSGPNAGMYALTIPMTLHVNATRPGGASVNMQRRIEVALIPVFQFGVYCAYDCAFMPLPNFGFGGRVHANGSIFLGAINNLVFHDRVTAAKQIVLNYLENDATCGSANLNGHVYIPKAAGGCPFNAFPPSGSNCIQVTGTCGSGSTPGDASWYNGRPGGDTLGTVNSNFPTTVSTARYNGYLANSTNGVTALNLNFVQNGCNDNPPPCTDPISIIRKPLASESASSTLGQARIYNKAQIRILLADTIADLHPERGAAALDSEDVQFGITGISVDKGSGTSTEYFGLVTPGSNDWVNPYTYTGATAQLTTWASFPLLGSFTNYTNATTAPTTGAWIRIEYRDSTGNYHGITNQWLGYGFGRQFDTALKTPYAPGLPAGSNKAHPKAILILQQLRPSGAAPYSVHGTSVSTPYTSSSWYPINFYDTREGEARDTAINSSSCSVVGIMNAVELDVGNLAQWLAGNANYSGGSGTSVENVTQNGYIVYFSDHRGALPSLHPSNGGATPTGVITGESEIEDVVNYSMSTVDATNAPNGALEPLANSFYTYSPEDANLNGFLDNQGAKNLGYGFGINTNTSPLNPYARVSGSGSSACNRKGLANPVTGARHVLKLVDGGTSSTASYLPMPGFSVATENPVYIQGDYNSSSSDTYWATSGSASPNWDFPHSAASIVADGVTILSNNWSDLHSLTAGSSSITNSGVRKASPGGDTHYRVAVSTGSNIPFQHPSWGGWDAGTDGGLLSFLRYLEDWRGVDIDYSGSLVTLYYAEYVTGIYKCCTTVYYPPDARLYYFDNWLLNPNHLPPGTPMLQDVVNLSYQQNYTAQ